MTDLEIVRLLQNPLGQVAPPGHRGDLVRVSDGRAKVYLDPSECDRASEDDLRALLAAARLDAAAARDAARNQPAQALRAPTGAAPSRRRAPAKPPIAGRSAADSPLAEPSTEGSSTAGRGSPNPPSLTAPRRAGRPAAPLW